MEESDPAAVSSAEVIWETKGSTASSVMFPEATTAAVRTKDIKREF
jgi:hypothetical protein